jgi:diaminopimelate epimerase
LKIPLMKMHGVGNDFILMDRKDIPVNVSDTVLAESVCHRHFGIGADGLMIAEDSETADVKMVYYNSDGSQGELCGNGIRCFAHYINRSRHASGKKAISVETLAGIKQMTIADLDDLTSSVTVEMGTPQVIQMEASMNAAGHEIEYSYLIMGVPHVVIFTDHPSPELVDAIGPKIEIHPHFEHGTNVNFCYIENRNRIRVWTWERGAGHTLGCGTGVSSVCAAAFHLGKTGPQVQVETEGGTLEIQVNQDDSIVMKGPAREICTGLYEYN